MIVLNVKQWLGKVCHIHGFENIDKGTINGLSRNEEHVPGVLMKCYA